MILPDPSALPEDRDALAAHVRRSVAGPLRAKIAELEAALEAALADNARLQAPAPQPAPPRWTELSPEQQQAELDRPATWAEHVVWRQVFETRTHREWIATGRDWTKETK